MRRSQGMRILPLAVAAACVAACSTEECLQNQTSLPLAGFYASGMATPTQISLDSVTIYGIGAPDDSTLVNVGKNLSESYLPFRIDSETTQFVFRYDQEYLSAYSLADTITFRYDIVPYFVSSACGVVYKYEMKEITTTHWLIDSVTCPRGVIDNDDIENIKIYFRVATE